MNGMNKQYDCWALSHEFGSRRILLGFRCWILWLPREPLAVPVRLFCTRRQAREAQADCCYKPTRVERIRVTVDLR